MRYPPVLLVLALAGCTDWHPVEVPSPDRGPWEVAGHLRVTTVQGASLWADTVRQVHDSLQILRARGAPVAPLPDALVASVQRREFSGTKTLLRIAVVVVVLQIWAHTVYP